MNINKIVEIGLVILVIAGYFVTGNYFRKRSKNYTGILRWMLSYRGFVYIVGGIALILLLIYYFFVR
jgi:threonine/homoserine/homoserine lactone efflux protein